MLDVDDAVLFFLMFFAISSKGTSISCQLVQLGRTFIGSLTLPWFLTFEKSLKVDAWNYFQFFRSQDPASFVSFFAWNLRNWTEFHRDSLKNLDSPVEELLQGTEGELPTEKGGKPWSFVGDEFVDVVFGWTWVDNLKYVKFSNYYEVLRCEFGMAKRKFWEHHRLPNRRLDICKVSQRYLKIWMWDASELFLLPGIQHLP